MGLEVPENVKAFNFWTLWIMAQLWEEFPVSQRFDAPRDIVAFKAQREHAGGQPIEPGDLPPVELFTPTMNWLISEGFVRGKGLDGRGVYADVRLTEKGFSILNEVPSAVAGRPTQKDKPLGAQMREAAVSMGKDLVIDLVKQMFSGNRPPS
jgi:hypothetical protein